MHLPHAELRLTLLLPCSRKWPCQPRLNRRLSNPQLQGVRYEAPVPWVKVPHLASHILGRMARTLSVDWQRVYAHPIYFVETFIEPQRFAGTCYRAANWTVLGETTGRGKDDLAHKANRSIKQVLGYPLVKDFRKRLSQLAA